MKRNSTLLISSALLCLLTACADKSTQQEAATAMNERSPKTHELTYPKSKQDNVVDTYFGTEVADPYR